MEIKGHIYEPIGSGLGYCLGGTPFNKRVFYFKGYPEKPYEECEILELKDADPESFESDDVMGEGRDKNNRYFQGRKVEKGKGVHLNQDWEFVPLKGIKCQSVELFFDRDRSIIRGLLGNEEAFNFSRSELEDSYEEFQDTDTWFRLVYNASDQLKEIEFLEGSLRLDDVVIIGQEKSAFRLKDQLTELGFQLIRQDDEHWIDKENKFTFSSSEDMGGDDHECVYFYTSDNMDHLISG